MSRSWHQAVTCTLWLLDEGQGVAQVGLERVLGGEDVLAGADLDGAVVAGSADELPYGPAGAVLDEPGYGQGREDDGQMCLDGVPLAMVDRPCPEVRLGHPERFFDLQSSW